MNIDDKKLNRLKALHLSYLTQAERDRVVAVEEGFELDGLLIEGIPGMDKLLAPDEVKTEDYVFPKRDEEKGTEVTELPKGEVLPMVEVVAPVKKKRITKKKA